MGSAIVQGLLWSRAAQDWAELQEPVATPLYEILLDAARVGMGTRLLDAGCGAGGASALAAWRGAHVNGVDAAEALLAIARQRVPDGDFRVGDLEHLPYATGIFDAILAVDVLPYLAAPVATVQELRRVCAPDGHIAIAIWGATEKCDQYAIFAAVRELLPAPLALEPFAFSLPGALDALLAQAGLRVCGGDIVTCAAVYPDQETAWQAQASSGPLQAAARVVGEQRLKTALLRALAPYTTRAGSVRLQCSARYLLAVPGDADRGRTEKGGGSM